MEFKEVQDMIDAAMDRYEHNIGLARHKENQAKFDELMIMTRDNGSKTTELSIGVTKLHTQMDALYGNGSGRKGAIERMDEKIDKVLEDVNHSQGEAGGSEKTAEKYKSVIMWVLGGVASAGLAFLLEYLKK